MALDGNGALILKWKCDHPRGSRGTVYHVSRQLDGHHTSADGGFEFLGIAGRKRLEDARLPPGVKRALYEVRAFRSTSSGMTATHIVNFGFSSHGLPVPGKMQLAA